MPPAQSALSPAKSLHRRLAGGLTAGLLGASALAAGVVVAPMAASATVAHDGCQTAVAGASSGWCGLYPGNATSNVRALGQVSVSPYGNALLVQTQDAASGAAPATSFACVVDAPASQITHRLQDTQCAKAGGLWVSSPGGYFIIDLRQYPQFVNTQLTVQVAANQSAHNSNGDAFYNNFSVSTVAGGSVFTS